MKNKYSLFFKYTFFLIILSISNIFNIFTIKAEEANLIEADTILIEAEIYKLKDYQKVDSLDAQLKKAVLLSTPRLMTKIGKSAEIETGGKKDEEILNIHIESNKEENNYDLVLQLTNKGGKSVSRIENHSLNGILTLSVSINDSTMIVKIKTKTINHEFEVKPKT